MNALFLFEELETTLPAEKEESPIYTTPIEQASFDIMELVDIYFKPTVTVEVYDSIQNNVKRILTEAFNEKSIGITSGGNRLLLVRPESTN